MQTASRLCYYKYIIIIIIIYSYTPYVHNLKFLNVTLLQSYNVTFEHIKRDLSAELRGALIEAKESIEGKRKLNTLDKLINELRDSNL